MPDKDGQRSDPTPPSGSDNPQATVTTESLPALHPGAQAPVAEPLSPLLTGNLRKQLFWLALPTLGEQILGSMVTIVDAWLAGHLSRDAVNAVGFSVYISWLVWMVFTAVGAGATAVVARAIGGGRKNEARTAVSQAIGVSVIAGALATLIIVSTAPLIAWIVWGDAGPATRVPLRPCASSSRSRPWATSSSVSPRSAWAVCALPAIPAPP